MTGGSGFIGMYLVKKLQNIGHDVICFDKNIPKWIEPKTKVIIGDINDFEKLKNVARDVECIFHCAGILGSTETFSYIEKTFEVNVFGTLNLLKLAKKLDIPMVYLSLKNDCMNPYMISKRIGTELCQSYSAYLDTRVCAINGLNGYGPRQALTPIPKMVPNMITSVLNGKKIKINGDGKQIVDVIYVEDMAHIMYLAFEKNCWGTKFDAGTGQPRTVKQIAHDVISVLGKGEIEYLPMRKGEHNRSIALADPSFLVQSLDYFPETSWSDGLKETVKWYKSELS
ncbi:NAD-dependent epimerase/dehydratase family protein [Deltaproteobacteria bacterium]|nr:NAD-dependent epimerase/dehydratase family protein [Deltaproteobacteria bacterium]